MPQTAMEEVEINEDLVITNFAAKDSETVIRALCQRLNDAGYVKEEYAEAVINRERVYPTGLPTSIPVAIPHADPELCIRSAVAVATLSDPVPFGEMGKRDSFVSTQLVLLPALCTPINQIRWLTRLVNMFNDEKTMEELIAIETPSEIVKFWKVKLNEASY